MDEFANIHLIKMNGSGGAWIDYDLDGDWDLYLVNCQGDNDDIANALYENIGNGKFKKKFILVLKTLVKGCLYQ